MATVTMPPPSPPTTAQAEFGKYFRRVVFERHAYRGRRLIKGVVASLDGKALDTRRVRRPQASLLPEAMERESATAISRLDAVLDARTFPCRVRGTRLVSVKDCDPFVLAWNDAVALFDAGADSIVARRQEIVDYNRDFWLPEFGGDERIFADRIGSKIPGPEALRARFSVKIYLDDLGDFGDGFSSALAEAFFTEAATNRAVLDEEVVRDAASAPADYAAALRAFLAKVESGTRVDDRSLTDARTLGQRCLGMTAIIAPEVYEAIATLDAVLASAQIASREAIEEGRSATAYFKARKATLGAKIAATIALCEDDAAQQQMLSLFGVSGPRGLAFESDFDD